MPYITNEELLEFLKEAGLENAGYDVVFRWGLKIVEFDKKNYLEALTIDEYKAAVKKDENEQVTEEELATRTCIYVNQACSSETCTGVCRLRRTGPIVYCRCYPQ